MTRTTTLNHVKAANLPKWELDNLIFRLGKKQADNEALPISKILEVSGYETALWVNVNVCQDHRLARHFQAWCAEQVQPMFGTDPRIVQQIAMLRNDMATEEQRAAARAAAYECIANSTYAAGCAIEAAANPSPEFAIKWAVTAKVEKVKARQWASENSGSWAAHGAYKDARNAQEVKLREMLEEPQ